MLFLGSLLCPPRPLSYLLPLDLLLTIAEQGKGGRQGPFVSVSVWGCLPEGLSPRSQQTLGPLCDSAVWGPKSFPTCYLPF